MFFIGSVLIFALTVYIWIILLNVAISWLIVFEVINTKNPKATNLIALLNKATEPVYKPIRKYVPTIGGIDISPLIVIVGIFILQHIIGRLFFY